MTARWIDLGAKGVLENAAPDEHLNDAACEAFARVIATDYKSEREFRYALQHVGTVLNRSYTSIATDPKFAVEYNGRQLNRNIRYPRVGVIGGF